MSDDASPEPKPAVAAPSHAERARTIVATRGTGALSTLAIDPPGYPHGSLVAFALDGGDPVFLISRLATHTKNLEADPRASLLVTEDVGNLGDVGGAGAAALARGRVTLFGPCRRLEDDASARAAFLAAHPSAAAYVGFADFGFFRLHVEAVRYIGGFGRMSWVDPEAWRAAAPDPLAPHAAGIVAHMNEDHADALLAYARAFTAAADARAAVMTGIDRHGFEMRVETGEGERAERLAFERAIATPTEARKALVGLVRKARAALSDR